MPQQGDFGASEGTEFVIVVATAAGPRLEANPADQRARNLKALARFDAVANENPAQGSPS